MKRTHSARWRCAIIGSAILAASPSLASEKSQDFGVIRFKAGDAQVQILRTAAEKTVAINGLVHPQDGRHIVAQFSGPLTKAQRDALAEMGLSLQAPLGNYAHFATLAPVGEARVADLAAFEPLRSVASIDRSWKLHSLLRENAAIDWAVVPAPGGERDAADPTIAAYVMFHPDEPMGVKAADLVNLYGATVRAELMTVSALVVELPRSMITRLADEDAVQWIEPALPQYSELSLGSAARNDSNRARTGADIAQAAPYSLDGTGVSVFVFDGGAVRATHQTYGGRATVIDGDGVSSHATHVAGTIGGNGAASGTPSRAGMAPNVTILSAGFEWGPGGTFLYSNPGDVEADYNLAINTHDADLANNSIGSNTEPNGFDCAIQGDYGLTDTLIDGIVRGSMGRPFRVVWANGNERQGSRCDIEGHGDYYSIAPPATAKNHMTVGALNSNDDSMTSFSSWGPTDDGRMKPDISGPGCQSSGNDSGVTSSTSGSDTAYGSNCGTSMSSPTIAGLSALVLQDFRLRFPGLQDPRNSTLRALFSHTAEDVFNPGPDYKSGYGSVRVIPAIDFMRTGRMQESLVAQGETFSTTINVVGGSPLKVTIAWDDAPGTPNAAVALVNNLDLRLIDPMGVVHMPWTLNPMTPAADAVRDAANSRDNIEQVMVDNPMPGTWTVEIIGTDVPQGPQPVSMVGAGQTSGVQISLVDALPTIVLPGESITVDMDILTLNQDLVEGSAVVNYRYDDGAFTASEMTPLGDNRFRASFPAPPCGQVVQFYFAAAGTFSGGITEPFGAPAMFFTTGVGVDSVPFADSFDTDQGWTVVNTPVTGSFTGGFERGVPAPATGTPLADAEATGAGFCFVTDNRVGNFDIDAGLTTLTSPVMDASGGVASVSYHRWFYNGNGQVDVLRVEISGDGGGSWQVLETVGPVSLGGWNFVTHPIPAALATDQFRIRFTASDLEVQSVVEAAVDGVRVDVRACDDGPACPADWDGDELVNSNDISSFLTAWLADVQNGTTFADFDGGGQVNSNDISAFLSAWLDAVQNGC